MSDQTLISFGIQSGLSNGGSATDAQKIVVTAKNKSGGTLVKGTPVHAITPVSSGQLVEVIAARADTPSAMPATLVLDTDLADEEEGDAIVVGFIKNVNTSAFTAGDIIYVAATGGYTNVKPTGTNLIQNLGVVVKSSASAGSGIVYGSGRSNDVPNIRDGYVWIGNASQVATPTLLESITASSLNTLTGDLTLAAGANVTITDNGTDTITIASSGGGGGGTNNVQHAWAFFDSTIQNVFLPITTETNSTSRQRYNRFVAPFSGSLTACTFYGTANQSGGTGMSLEIQKMTAGSASLYTSLETQTLSSLTSYTSSTMTFTSNTFSAGDVLYFFLTNGFSTFFGNLSGTLFFSVS